MEWKIVADSSCDLIARKQNFGEIDFDTVPLKIIVGQNEYIDNEDADIDAMFADIKTGAPSSSACPSPGEWYQSFLQSDNIIAVTISSALSGSYNSALVARDLILEKFPDKNIYVQDSHSTAGGMVILIEKAIELITNSGPFEKITSALAECEKKVATLVTLSSFETLVNNGRMSKFAGMIAGTLGLRAIAMTNEKGEIKVIDKCRGEQSAINRIIKHMSGFKDITGARVVISHCDNPEGAESLKQGILDSYSPGEISIIPTRVLTSFYAGKNGLIISF